MYAYIAHMDALGCVKMYICEQCNAIPVVPHKAVAEVSKIGNL